MDELRIRSIRAMQDVLSFLILRVGELWRLAALSFPSSTDSRTAGGSSTSFLRVTVAVTCLDRHGCNGRLLLVIQSKTLFVFADEAACMSAGMIAVYSHR